MAKHKVAPEELRKKPPEELRNLISEWRSELISLRHRGSIGTLENPGRLRELRRNIARALTILREKERSSA